MNKGGLVLEPIKRKDYVHEKMYGSSYAPAELKPLGRDISNVPVVFQGDLPHCVAATVTWIRQFQNDDSVDLSHEYLAELADIGPLGAKPSQVLEPARKKGIAEQTAWDEKSSLLNESAEKFKVSGYSRVTDLSIRGLYSALKVSPLAIGVRDWKGVGPHFMAAFDITDDGLAFKCVNWWDKEKTMVEEVPFKEVVVAYSFIDPKNGQSTKGIRAGVFPALLSLVTFYKKISALIFALLTVIGSFFGLSSEPQNAPYSAFIAQDGSRWLVEPLSGKIEGIKSVETDSLLFGAGYTPITGYKSNLTSRIAAADTSIPVSSILDDGGNAINLSNVSPSSTVRVYFTIEPGKSRQEVVYCTGLTGNNWTPCTRGLAFQGDSLSSSSTLAQIHPAGSEIIISNVGVYFREFVSIDGTQRIDGEKTFLKLPKTSATQTVPTSDDQLVNKYYADSIIAGGLSSQNASTSLAVAPFSGITNCSTSGTCFGLYVSSTDSGNGGFINIKTDNVTSTIGRLYFDLPAFLAKAVTVTANWVFSGTVTLQSILGDIIKFPSATTSTVTGLVGTNWNDLGQFSATGTAGITITAGQALYISPTSSLFLASASGTQSTYPYVGIAQANANVGQTVIYVRPGGIARGLSGLTAGSNIYLGNTPGGVTSTSPGSVPAKLGRALSSTTLQLEAPDFKAIYLDTFNGTVTGASDFTGDINWLPNRVTIYGSSTTAIWEWTQNGVSTTYSGNPSITNFNVATGTKGFILYMNHIIGDASSPVKAEYDLQGIDLH